MSTFEIVLIVLNLMLVWGFAIAIFSRTDAKTKTAGVFFGIVAACNLFYVVTQSGLL